jgi:hypothetical protein
MAAKFDSFGTFDFFDQSIGIVGLLFGSPPSITGGGAVAARTLTLPRNGVLSAPFSARLRVVQAEWFAATDVAQVRDGSSGGTGTVLVVLDFGTARPVGSVASVSSSVSVTSVQRWLGASFEASALPLQQAQLRVPPLFSSEVRTERLLVTCSASSFTAAREALAVMLPEIPADLELRLDGGAPIWTSPGTVTAGSLGANVPQLALVPGASANGAQRWRADPGSLPAFVQDVDLSAHLNALAGDPDAAHGDTRDVTVTLSSRIPGAIALELPSDLSSRLRHVARVTDGFVEGRRDVAFSSEGVQAVPLVLPAWAQTVHAASLVVSGTLDANRTLPPLGPAPTMLDAKDARDGVAQPVAEFVIDSARTLALPILPGHGLLALGAVRVPLIADRSGCELRAVLLAEDEASGGPGAPLDGGAGSPVAVEPLADGAEQWITLPFPTPYTLPADADVFVALHMVRGTASLAASRQPQGLQLVAPGATDGIVPAWRGPPTGPWEAVPDSADLAGLRGRLRLTGTAPNDRPVPPVRMALGRLPTRLDGVTPGPKGVPVQLTDGGPLRPAELRVVSLTPGTVTLRDVVVTVSAAS